MPIAPNKTTKKGLGRVRFLAHIDVIRQQLEEGWPRSAVLENLMAELDMSYQQFLRYVDEHIKRGVAKEQEAPLTPARSDLSLLDHRDAQHARRPVPGLRPGSPRPWDADPVQFLGFEHLEPATLPPPSGEVSTGWEAAAWDQLICSSTWRPLPDPGAEIEGVPVECADASERNRGGAQPMCAKRTQVTSVDSVSARRLVKETARLLRRKAA